MIKEESQVQESLFYFLCSILEEEYSWGKYKKIINVFTKKENV